jgi:hypothetical protein
VKKRLVRLLGPTQRAYAKRLIDEAPDGDFVSLSAPTRTLEQNAKLWPMLEDIQQQVAPHLSTEDIKLQFLNALGVEMRFLPTLEGQGMFPVGLRSSTLTKEQFSGLIELIYEYGAKHEVRWSEPAEREKQRRAA